MGFSRRLCWHSRPGVGDRLVRIINEGSILRDSVILRVIGPAYWVSPTGASAWSAARSSDPLSGTACCSLSTAIANAVAGDLVYFRGGTYSITGSYREALKPANSGISASLRIVFQAYGNEVPIIDGAGSTHSYGLAIVQKSYIKIDGLTIKGFYCWATINASSHYNEITRCKFYSDTGEDVTWGILINGMCVGGASQTCPSTHNWVHHNELHDLHSQSDILDEGTDLIRIGSDNDIYGDDHNTVEDNTIYHAGHTCFDGYGLYTVIKNNVFHNEPWWSDDSVGKTTTLTSAIGPSDSTINVVSTASMAQADFTWGYIMIDSERISYSGRTATSFTGCTRGISGTTGASHSLGATVSCYARYRPDMFTNQTYRGKFGHRCFQITDGGTRDAMYSLIEGNRFGHAGANPNNNGADGCDIAGPRCIVRFNDIFNNMHAGVMFKYGWGGSSGNGGCYTKFYNNTLYHNGYGNPRYELADSGVSTAPESLLNIRFYYGSTTVGNIIKNNIAYDSRRYALSGFDIGVGASDETIPSGTVMESNWWTENGDPKFVDPDVSDASNFTKPDLSLQGDSPCIGAGTNLTQTNGLGVNSIALAVQDASYFQDGTWGSALAYGITMFPDWIAIGTVDNIVEISSIDYATNAITLATPATWADGAPVWLYSNSSGERVLYGTAPDLGAHGFVQ